MIFFKYIQVIFDKHLIKMKKKNSFNSPKFKIGDIVMNLNESFLSTGDSEYGGTKYRVGKIISIDTEYPHSIKYSIKHRGQEYINISEKVLELYDATKDTTIKKKKKQRRAIGKKNDIEKNNKLNKIKIQNRNRVKTKEKKNRRKKVNY